MSAKMEPAKTESATQQRVMRFFQNILGYQDYGNWQYRKDNSNIENDVLSRWLKTQGYEESLIRKALRKLRQATLIGDGKKLYQANEAVYGLLRYGVKVSQSQGKPTQTVWLINWKQALANEFGVAQEVSVNGENNKRPDIVLYVNGIALGVIELKRSKVSVSKGIQQNLDNQKKAFIRDFYSTLQLVMAGNDSEGLRYGTIETPEKHYYRWKEENLQFTADKPTEHKKHLSLDDCSETTHLLDFDLLNLCRKERLLELIHDFVVFDAGVKKLSRQNQYFGVKAAQKYIAQGKGGIIWHTQGSGKSLTMVWLAKWIRQYQEDSRVLIITDRTELDEQIEGVFLGVDEEIYRSKSGTDLLSELNSAENWLLCSLVHKFGSHSKDDATDGILHHTQK